MFTYLALWNYIHSSGDGKADKVASWKVDLILQNSQQRQDK